MTTRTHRATAFVRLAFVALTALAACGCGATGAPAAAPVSPAQIIDADPLALFPGGAVVLGNLDTRAFYASGSAAAQLAALLQSAIPPGQELGVSMSQDVDRMLVAAYAGAGLDAVAVLCGRFDGGRMQAAAAAHPPTGAGSAWAVLPYAGRTLYASRNMAISPLTDHTLLAGSESAVRRLLDRLAQGGAQPRTSRELSDWMLKTVESQGAAFALAADIGAIPPALLQGWPLPAAMTGLSRVAVISDFHPPGLNVASTFAYVESPARAGGSKRLAAVQRVRRRRRQARCRTAAPEPQHRPRRADRRLQIRARRRVCSKIAGFGDEAVHGGLAASPWMTDLVVHPAERGLCGSVTVPSDKSIGHRALLLAALAAGTSRIQGFSRGEDNLSTLKALRALGVPIEEVGATELRIVGVCLRGLRASTGPLECGNSGTTMRLLAGLLAAQPFASTLVGDASLSSRPMMRVMGPLRSRGATIDGRAHPIQPSERTAPLTVGPLPPSRRLGPLDHDSPVSSAQVKSAVLLSGLDASGPTIFREPFPSRDHTERMLRALGAPVETTACRVALDPNGWDGRLAPVDLAIPGDLSAAAFILVAAQIVHGSRVTVSGVGINPTRSGIFEIARDMGAGLTVEPSEERAGEPVGTLRGFHEPLVATRADARRVARAIDEVCIACALAARADGETRIEGAAELRVKESDRLMMMARTLRAFGVACEETVDGLVIEGTPNRLRAAEVESGGDHRVAMTAAVLGLVADGPEQDPERGLHRHELPGFRVDLARGGRPGRAGGHPHCFRRWIPHAPGADVTSIQVSGLRPPHMCLPAPG